MKAEAIMLFREDVLTMGRLVDRTVEEMLRMLRKDPSADMGMIEQQEVAINRMHTEIEERCLDLLLERDALQEKDIRTLFVSASIASKFERMADHANRVAKIGMWAREDNLDIPPELPEMAAVVHKMVQEVLLCYITNSADKAREILQRDAEVNYFDDVLSKKLLSDLGSQDTARAQMRAQFLFGGRFLERMGDLAASIAKRSYFIATGERIKPKASGIA